MKEGEEGKGEKRIQKEGMGVMCYDKVRGRR